MNEDIRTPRILLRKFLEADRNEFVRIITDPVVNRFIGGRTGDKDAAGAIFDKIAGIYSGSMGSRHFELWAVEYEGRLIGEFELKQTDNTLPDELEIVYMIDKTYWGLGIMPEIIKKVLEYSVKYGKKIVATMNPENQQTIRVLEKSGIKSLGWETIEGDKVYKAVLQCSRR